MEDDARDANVGATQKPAVSPSVDVHSHEAVRSFWDCSQVENESEAWDTRDWLMEDEQRLCANGGPEEPERGD